MKAFLINIINRVLVKIYKKASKLAEQSDWETTKGRFKSIGINSYVPSPRSFYNPQFIVIGSNFRALHNTRIEAFNEHYGSVYSPEIIIGDNVSMNSDCHLGCIDKIHIGDNVLIASRVYISDHSHGETDEQSISVVPNLRPLSSKGPIIIEDNVWIGEGVCILSGVTIGKNSIIGANSVVTKSIPCNCVAVGVPAKVIKII